MILLLFRPICYLEDKLRQHISGAVGWKCGSKPIYKQYLLPVEKRSFLTGKHKYSLFQLNPEIFGVSGKNVLVFKLALKF